MVLPRSMTAYYRRPYIRVVPIENLCPSLVTLIWNALVDNSIRDEFIAAALACRDYTI